LSIRLTEDEKKKVSDYAKQDDLSISEYIKRTALKQAVFSNRLEYTTDLKRLNFEIGKAGNNINQMAAHANRTAKFQAIDAATINQFHLFMEQYLTLLDEVDATLKGMFRKMSKIK